MLCCDDVAVPFARMRYLCSSPTLSFTLGRYTEGVALSYLEVYTLRRLALNELLANSPLALQVVQRWSRRITIQRSLLKYLAVRNGRPGPRSFVPKSMAVEPELVDDSPSWEQRVDTAIANMDASLQAIVCREDGINDKIAEVKAMLEALVSTRDANAKAVS